jgi:hypothetical protein
MSSSSTINVAQENISTSLNEDLNYWDVTCMASQVKRRPKMRTTT